jgi:excisionase family DNA binding protein
MTPNLLKESDVTKSSLSIQDRTSLSVEEVCQMLGVRKPTIYRFIHSGELPSYRIGRRRLIRREALSDFQKRLETKHTDALKGSRK